MQLDLYTARQRLSSQHWRLYRVGPLAELEYLCQQLNQRQVPSSCFSIEAIKAIPVWRVVAILAFEPQIKLVTQLPESGEKTLIIDRAEVSQWLTGQLPSTSPWLI